MPSKLMYGKTHFLMNLTNLPESDKYEYQLIDLKARNEEPRYAFWENGAVCLEPRSIKDCGWKSVDILEFSGHPDEELLNECVVLGNITDGKDLMLYRRLRSAVPAEKENTSLSQLIKYVASLNFEFSDLKCEESDYSPIPLRQDEEARFDLLSEKPIKHNNEFFSRFDEAAKKYRKETGFEGILSADWRNNEFTVSPASN